MKRRMFSNSLGQVVTSETGLQSGFAVKSKTIMKCKRYQSAELNWSELTENAFNLNRFAVNSYCSSSPSPLQCMWE